jgi:hypothetical protein
MDRVVKSWISGLISADLTWRTFSAILASPSSIVRWFSTSSAASLSAWRAWVATYVCPGSSPRSRRSAPP